MEPDGPQSIQPLAERLGLLGHDQLHHFIISPAWDDAALWRVLAEQADRQVGGDDAVLVVDDSGLPKKGTASVGVAAQYCGGDPAGPCSLLMFIVTEEAATAIRTAFDQGGELAVAVELRRLFPVSATMPRPQSAPRRLPVGSRCR